MKKALLLFSFCLPALGFSQSWSDQNSGITNDLDDVYFVDDNTGWAVGRQGKIIRTTDGGASWTQQNSGTTKDLNKVYMVSSSAGYAVGDGGTVVKYNGSSWLALNINFSQDMYGVYFLDASTGWVSGDWGCIKMTTNGGSSWTTQMNNSIFSNSFYDLHMLSVTEGWAVGSSGKILKYNGSNWSGVSNPATSNMTDLHAVSFTSSNDGFASGESSGMFHWDGSSWVTYNTDLSNNSFHIYDVHLINSSLGYAATTPGIGGNGVILKYDGNTWKEDYKYTGMNSELFSGITSTSGGKIIAVGATGMIKMKSSGGTPTSLSENDGMLTVTIYPNPSSGSFVFALPEPQSSATVKISDISGKLLANLHSTTGTIRFDGSTLESGVYFYTVNTAQGSASGRIIKN